MDNPIVSKLIYDLLIPLIGLAVVLKAGEQAFKFLKTLWVSGDANEWVLIMKNGEQVKAGVGLTCFKGPFDQVAKFPSKVHKVEFSTQQVTKEMQGVQVSGILVWSINREGDAPMRAFKNLGTDLNSENPRTANDNLVSMSNAIVRSCIANSTIEEMLRNRNMVRDAIKKEMFEVVKGWGVWLETVEITEVLISSNSLFKDMQADFREKMRKNAEIEYMTQEKEINDFKAPNEKAQDRKDREMQQKKTDFRQASDLVEKEEMQKFEARLQEIKQARAKVANELEEFQQQLRQERDLYNSKLAVDQAIAWDSARIEDKKSREELYKVEQETEKLRLEEQRKRELAVQEANISNDLAKAELEKENFDEVLLRQKAIEIAKACYRNRYIAKTRLTKQDPNDLGSAVISSLVGKHENTKVAQGLK